MTFFLDKPPSGKSDGATAKGPTAGSFADVISSLSDRPINPSLPQAKSPAEASPKPLDPKGAPSESKGKTPDVPKPFPASSRLTTNSTQPKLSDYFSIPEGSTTRPDVLIPQPKLSADGKSTTSKSSDAIKSKAPDVTPSVAPKAPEPKSDGKAPTAAPPTVGGGEVRPFYPRPGVPSSEMRLPGLSRDRMLSRPAETPKSIIVPKESLPPSTTVIVPKRDAVKTPADTKPPAVVDTTKPPAVVDKSKPPTSSDTSKLPPKPIVIDVPKTPPNPYKPLPKVDYDQQKGTGPDAVKTTPDGAPPKYPGPAIDQDKWIMQKLLKPSPLGKALYEMYLATATDRSEENKVPDGIKIAELHKGIKEKVASIELLGDSEMFQPDQHGIILHPTGRRHPGNFYAVLRDDKGIPINVIEYSKTGGNGKPKYLQQWIFDREADKDTGGRTTTISYFRESSSTAVGRPGVENKTMADVYMGRTDYLAGRDGSLLKATQFNNLNKPTVEIDYSTKTPSMQLRDPNSGQLRTAPYSRAFTTNMAFSGAYLK